MKKERFKITPAVQILLIKEDGILLQKRKNTGYKDGWYGLPSGHLDGGETATNGIIREVYEEVGIEIIPKDLELKLTMHRMSKNGEYIDWFFMSNRWQGEIVNKEPEKCSDLSFYPINCVPENTIAYIIYAIECINFDKSFVEFGWEDYRSN